MARRRSRSASRPTARRRCTSCAPRRATRSSARRRTGRSRRTTWAWAGRSPASKDFIGRARCAGPTRSRTDRRSWSACCRSTRESRCPRAPSWSPRMRTSPTPVPMPGWVTSSYRSAALGRTFALALVEGGRSRHGERLRAVLPRPCGRGRRHRPGPVRPGERSPRRGRWRRSPCAAPGAPFHRALRLAARRPFDGLRLPPAALPLPAQSHARRPRRPVGPGAAAGRRGPPRRGAATRAEHGHRHTRRKAEGRLAGPRRVAGDRRSGRRPGTGARLLELARTGGAVVDVSAGRAGLVLSGSTARALLEHGCSVDLHPRSFGPGRAAQTELALTHALVLAIDDAPTYWVYVRPSFAGYLADWLTDADLSGD